MLAVPASASAQEPARGLEGRRLDDIRIAARHHDGYWDWYWAYLDQREAERRRTGEIRIQLSVLASEIRDPRRVLQLNAENAEARGMLVETELLVRERMA